MSKYVAKANLFGRNGEVIKIGESVFASDDRDVGAVDPRDIAGLLEKGLIDMSEGAHPVPEAAHAEESHGHKSHHKKGKK